MTKLLNIRESSPADTAGIEKVYRDAFPDEDLLPLVRDLLNWGEGVLSLVAIQADRVVGHVGFTLCRIDGAPAGVALLAPLAVDPQVHGQGIGSALVDTGFQRVTANDIAQIFVLGDPNFYGRFGFVREDRVATPYPLPEEWRDGWQSVSLSAPAPEIEGILSVPGFWQIPALWAP